MRAFLYLLGAAMFLGVLVGLFTHIQPIIIYSGKNGAAEKQVFSWLLIAGLFVGGSVVWFFAGLGNEDHDDESVGSE